MTLFTTWAARTPKTWTTDSVVRIAPPADLDRSDVFLPCPAVPRLFIRFRRAGDGTFGTGTYTAVYARGGKDHRAPLGKVGAIAIDEVVRKAHELFAAAADPTRDPRGERAEAKAAHGSTFSLLVPEYLKHLRREGRKTRYVGIVERNLARYFPDLDALQVDLIKIKHCAAAIDRLLDPGPAWRGGRGTASFARAVLRSYFEWLIRKGHCESNPVERTEAYILPARKRTLTAAELGAVWTALDNDRVGRLFKLIVLTGCRRDQIGQLRKCWLHLDGSVPFIRLPGAEAGPEVLGNSKNGDAFDVALSRQAVAILHAQLAANPRNEFVFGLAGAKGGFDTYSKSLRQLQAKSGTEGWSLHDLRRTFVSLGASVLKVATQLPLHTLLDVQLNHTLSGVSTAGVDYQRNQFVQERLPVVQAWADYLDGLAPSRLGLSPDKLRLVAA
jgi:integrase